MMTSVARNLNSFVGNPRAVEILRRAVEQDRLPHALIFAGPSGIGKCTIAILLAQFLNCISPKPGAGCGSCSICRRVMGVLLARGLKCLSPQGDSNCGSCSSCRTLALKHPDIRLIQPEKTTISIDQVREAIIEIGFQPFEARYRVVILDPADQMRPEAQSSLLKTLEEPPSRTILILITTNPYVLFETIRSRSRLLHFGVIPQERIEKHLIEQEGRTAEEAQLAGVFSQGSLGQSLSFDVAQYREVRAQALRFVSLLLGRGEFAQLSPLVAGLAKDKESFQVWIDAVATLLQDIYYLHVAPHRIGQRDIQDELADLARTAPRSLVVSTVEALKATRAALLHNANRQIALEALFLELRMKAAAG